jgi:hypothetical protein
MATSLDRLLPPVVIGMGFTFFSMVSIQDDKDGWKRFVIEDIPSCRVNRKETAPTIDFQTKKLAAKSPATWPSTFS